MSIEARATAPEMVPAGKAFPGWVVIAFVAGVFAIGSEGLVVSPLLKDLAASTHTDMAQVGFVVSAYGISAAITAPLSGLLSDLLSRRVGIVGGLLLFVLAGLACAASQSFATLIGGRVLCGVAAGVFLPACYAYVGDEVPYEVRAQAMGRVMSGWALAVVLGVPLGGFLGEWVGWRGAFIAVAAIALGAALALLRLPSSRPSTQPRAIGSARWRQALLALGQAVCIPSIPLLLAVDFLEMSGFYGTYTYLGSSLRDTLHVTSGGAGLFIIFEGFGTIAITLMARVLDQVGKGRALLIGLLLHALVVALLPHAIMAHPMVLALTLFVWGNLQGTCMTCLSTIASQRAPAARGGIMALMSCMTYSGITFSAVAFGPVYQAPGLGYPVIGMACGLMLVLAAGLFWYSRIDVPGTQIASAG